MGINSNQQFKVSRVEALSDGVFAIVMTLLILELGIETGDTINTNQKFWQALKHLFPNFIAYFMSFMILGIYWVGHHNQLIYLKSLDRYALWINILFLSFISIIPFITALINEYQNVNAPIVLYCIHLVLIGLLLLLNWRYAYKNGLIIPEIDKKSNKRIQLIILIGPLVYLIALGLSFISNTVSIISIFIMQGFYVLHKGYDKKITTNETPL